MTLTSRPIPRTMKAINVGIGAATVLIVRPIPIHILSIPGQNSEHRRFPLPALNVRVLRLSSTFMLLPWGARPPYQLARFAALVRSSSSHSAQPGRRTWTAIEHLPQQVQGHRTTCERPREYGLGSRQQGLQLCPTEYLIGSPDGLADVSYALN